MCVCYLTMNYIDDCKRNAYTTNNSRHTLKQ